MARIWASERFVRMEQTVSCSAPTRASVARCSSMTSASTDWGITGAESSCRVAERIIANMRWVFADVSSRTSWSRERR